MTATPIDPSLRASALLQQYALQLKAQAIAADPAGALPYTQALARQAAEDPQLPQKLEATVSAFMDDPAPAAPAPEVAS